MPTKKLTTGEKIKKNRIQKGFTQKQLAQKCSMYESQIRKYETGKIHPKIETLQKIANALQVSVNSLRSDSELEMDFFTKYIQKTFDKTFDATIESLNIEYKLISDYRSLNTQGRQKALEQVELLTKIPEYQAKTETSADVPTQINKDENLTD